MKKLILAICAAGCALPAAADVVVRFQESAPKDSFSIVNEGSCGVANAEIELDLSTSASGLIFDVTATGAGVSVFQPLELVAGQDYLSTVPEVSDGDNKLNLSVETLAPSAEIAFTIDIDDTAGVSETMVSGAEIQDAQVAITINGATHSGNFGTDGVARIALNTCSA